MVVVAGAGPAGATVATLLARAGRDVVLVDRPREGRAVGEHLPAAARPLLHRLGLHHLLDGHEPCVGLASVWRGVCTERAAIGDPLGAGTLLDRRRFDDDLRREAVEAGVLFVDGRIREVTPHGDGLDVSGAWEGRAEMVVDATGRASHIARQLGREVQRQGRSVAWCRWQHDVHADRRLRVEDTDDGWFYTAPLPGGERVVVWHRPDGARVTAADFDAALDRAPTVRARAGGTWVDGPVGRSAAGQRLPSPCGPGWWAVGDAAMAFDPISSQGLLTALAGAEQLVAALGAGSPASYPRWCDRVWSRYVRERDRLGAPARIAAS